jgi:putative hydrolase of the HAD superfamily
MSEHFDLRLTPEQVAGLVAEYRQHRPRIEPHPDMLALLAEQQGKRLLGVLSDGYLPAQRLKLQALGIAPLLNAVVITEELGREFWKPSTRGYQEISRQLGVEHRHCCYVADNPAKDFVAPNKLGWLSVQFIRPMQIHAANAAPPGGRPQHIVHATDELVELLDA